MSSPQVDNLRVGVSTDCNVTILVKDVPICQSLTPRREVLCQPYD